MSQKAAIRRRRQAANGYAHLPPRLRRKVPQAGFKVKSK